MAERFLILENEDNFQRKELLFQLFGSNFQVKENYFQILVAIEYPESSLKGT